MWSGRALTRDKVVIETSTKTMFDLQKLAKSEVKVIAARHLA